MFTFRRLTFQPSEYVFRYKKGRLVSQGAGLSFLCRSRGTTVAMLPAGSVDAPFFFEELTSDFQTVTVQGQLVYRITDMQKAAGMLDYTLNLRSMAYRSDDPLKLPVRMTNSVRVRAKKRLERMPLLDAMRSGDELARLIASDLSGSAEISALGAEVLSVAVLAVLPVKETARALEARTREEILRLADDAVFERRNASIEQERRVRENEYNTEILVENKKRQVKETRMEARRAVQNLAHGLRAERLMADIELEARRASLVERQAGNARVEAESKAYALSGVMKALEGAGPGVLQTLASVGMEPARLMALAFQGLADKAGEIGQLNITPDLLREIMKG